MEKLTCPTCGFPVAPSDRICNNCGVEIPAQPAQAPVTVTAEDRDFRQDSAPHAATRAIPAERIASCPSCGYRNSPDDNFCSQCGIRLAGSSISTGTQVVEQRPKTKQSGQHQKKKKKQRVNIRTWQIVAAFLAVFAVVVIILLIQSGSERDTVESAIPSPAAIDLNALRRAQEFVDANPADPEGLLRLANLLHDGKLLDQAITQYKRYLAIVPDNPDARVDMGVCYYEQKNFTEAIREMEKAVRAHPSHQLGNFNLGIVNLAAGNKDDALRWFGNAVRIDPESEVGKKSKEIMRDAGLSGMAQ